jgi:hypothetical protein
VTAVTDEERELSALLERAVPQLPSPVQRLERVRERMRRRRRRRAAAAASATAVVVVAGAGLLLPGLGGDPGASGRRTDAATTWSPGASSGTAGPPVADGPTPAVTGSTAPPGYRLYSFPELAGLRLKFPLSWFTLTAPVPGNEYVSTQPLGLPKGGCVHPLDDFCTPLVRKLNRGGMLVQLEISHNQAMADKLRLTGWAVSPTKTVTACRTVGGTEQLTVEFPDRSGSDVLIEATACLSQNTVAQQARLRDVLTTADFS